MRTRPAVVAIGLALVLTQAGPGSAHLIGHRDAKDTDAGNDLRWVALNRSDHGRVVIANVRLWTEGEGRQVDRIIFSFDTRGDGRTDYYLRVRYDGASSGIWDAGLFRADWSRTPAKVSLIHTDEAHFPFWFPVSLKWWRLHATRHIRWRVSYRDEGQMDWAPNEGRYRH